MKNNYNQNKSLVCGVCDKEKDNMYCAFCMRETKSVYKLELADTISVKDSIKLRQKILGVKGWVIELFQGFKSSNDKSKFPDGVNLCRKFDKKSDWYDEIVKDEKTGKIIHECHEPLSEHVRHGSAKFK